VCIAVFNRVHYTQRCLELLRNQTYPELKIIVVDDGSTDGTSAMVKSEYPDVVLLRGDGSLYWTGAMHVGIEHVLAHAAADDFVLFLNDDLVFKPDLVERLLDTTRWHPRSLIQAVEACHDDPDLIWHGGRSMNWWTAKQRLVNHHRRISEFPPDHCEPSAYLTGRGVLVPLEVFRTAGNFDARYRQSGDLEFSRRAAKGGYSLLVSYGTSVLCYTKGDNLNEAATYALSDFWQYYFGVLSWAHLPTLWKDAMSMTESRVQGLVFFAFKVARVTVNFVRRLRLRKRAYL
jgi:GT2 family glycosyltransferase